MYKNGNRMERKFKKAGQSQNGNIRIDTKKCKACWKCIDICPDNVIGRINMPWHKHAKIINKDKCTGCLKCVKICDSDAVVNLKSIMQ